MFIFIAFILILLFTVLENWFREIERFNPNAIKGSHAGLFWHLAQLIALFITFIYICVIQYGFDNPLSYSLLFLLSSVWWIFFDGGLNLLRNKPFFKVTISSSDPFQAFSNPYIKLSFLLISISIFLYYNFFDY